MTHTTTNLKKCLKNNFYIKKVTKSYVRNSANLEKLKADFILKVAKL